MSALEFGKKVTMRSVAEIQADDRLWTVVELAHYLYKGKTWVYEQVRQNKIPHCRVGAK
jgi:hypothetical protein